jgi:hypothetical protein
MTLTGTLLRIFGAAILLIAVQFASVAAKAHVGHGHALDVHSVQGPGALAARIRLTPTRPRLRIEPREPNLPPKPRPQFKTPRARRLPTPTPA